MESNPLLLAAQAAVNSYGLVVGGHANDERGYRQAVLTAELARDLFSRHLADLENRIKGLREGWNEAEGRLAIPSHHQTEKSSYKSNREVSVKARLPKF